MMLLSFAFVISCIALTVVAGYVIQLRKRLRQFERQLESDIRDLSHELAAFNNSAMGAGRRLISLEKKLKLVIERQRQMALGNIENIPYHQAVASADAAEAELPGLLTTAPE